MLKNSSSSLAALAPGAFIDLYAYLCAQSRSNIAQGYRLYTQRAPHWDHEALITTCRKLEKTQFWRPGRPYGVIKLDAGILRKIKYAAFACKALDSCAASCAAIKEAVSFFDKSEGLSDGFGLMLEQKRFYAKGLRSWQVVFIGSILEHFGLFPAWKVASFDLFGMPHLVLLTEEVAQGGFIALGNIKRHFGNNPLFGEEGILPVVQPILLSLLQYLLDFSDCLANAQNMGIAERRLYCVDFHSPGERFNESAYKIATEHNDVLSRMAFTQRPYTTLKSFVTDMLLEVKAQSLQVYTHKCRVGEGSGKPLSLPLITALLNEIIPERVYKEAQNRLKQTPIKEVLQIAHTKVLAALLQEPNLRLTDFPVGEKLEKMLIFYQQEIIARFGKLCSLQA